MKIQILTRNDIKPGNLYEYHPHYGTRDFPFILLCLKTWGDDLFAYPNAEFLDIKTLKKRLFALSVQDLRCFVEITTDEST